MSEEAKDNNIRIEAKEWGATDIKPIAAPNMVSVYANNANVGFSNWDMWLTFGEIMGEEGGQLVVAQKARVVMSLQHAKAFIDLVNTNLAAFEKQFGEIKILSVLQKKDDSE